jgi:hypothetical protein
MALLIGVAVPQLATAALIGSGAKRGLAAGYLAGLLLAAWIAVQLLILQRFLLPPAPCGVPGHRRDPARQDLAEHPNTGDRGPCGPGRTAMTKTACAARE